MGETADSRHSRDRDGTPESTPFRHSPAATPDAPEGWKSGSSRFARLTMFLFQSGHCRLEPTTPDPAPISAPLVGRRAEGYPRSTGGSAPGSDRDTGLWAPAALIADDLLKLPRAAAR